MTSISIAREFSSTPGGRLKTDGPFSGQLFRERHLVPAFRRPNEVVRINIDGVAGLPPSFLEESFGGLVRVHGLDYRDVLRRLVVETSEPDLVVYKPMIERFIAEAGGQSGGSRSFHA